MHYTNIIDSSNIESDELIQTEKYFKCSEKCSECNEESNINDLCIKCNNQNNYYELKSNNKGTKNFLNCLDYIVDDRFDITKKTMDARFRGSYKQKMYEHNKSTNTWNEIYPYNK